MLESALAHEFGALRHAEVEGGKARVRRRDGEVQDADEDGDRDLHNVRSITSSGRVLFNCCGLRIDADAWELRLGCDFSDGDADRTTLPELAILVGFIQEHMF